METAEAETADTELQSMAASLVERAKLVVETQHVDDAFTVSVWPWRWGRRGLQCSAAARRRCPLPPVVGWSGPAPPAVPLSTSVRLAAGHVCARAGGGAGGAAHAGGPGRGVCQPAGGNAEGGGGEWEHVPAAFDCLGMLRLGLSAFRSIID